MTTGASTSTIMGSFSKIGTTKLSIYSTSLERMSTYSFLFRDEMSVISLSNQASYSALLVGSMNTSFLSFFLVCMSREPFMKASLRDRGEGLKNQTFIIQLQNFSIYYPKTCLSRPWGTRRPRSGRGSSWPAWSPRRPSRGWPCCCTSRHSAVSRTLACLPENQILTEIKSS